MNSVIILVSCHRLIGVDGTLVGYDGGLSAKEYSLRLEAEYRNKQINRLFSNLVAAEALTDLLLKYPEKSFRTHLGTESGFDIEVVDGTVVAECFAVTKASSNRKLKEDSEKLMGKAPKQEKYIYFYSENDVESGLERIYEKISDITYVRVTKLQ